MITLISIKMLSTAALKLIGTGACFAIGFSAVRRFEDHLEGRRLMRDKNLMEQLSKM
jgi:hypothetical protein